MDPKNTDITAGVEEKQDYQKKLQLKYVVLENKDKNHHNNYFCLNCLCQCCMEYRDVILEIWEDQLKTQNLWINVRSIIRNFYQPLLRTNSENQDIYKELILNSANWITCGHINKNKTKYLDLTSDLSLTDYMKLVLYSSILVDDHPQQFFELISFEIECVVRAYGNGLRKLISGESYSPKDVLIYVLNGYFELIKINDHVSSFLFSFESNHLKKFSCSLLLLTKKMYEYWLYTDFVDIMPECLIKLKTEIDQNECEHLIPEYITFDEDMILTNSLWEYVWLRIDSYNNSKNEKNKKLKTNFVNEMFDMLNKCSEKEDVNKTWRDIMDQIQKNWITRDTVYYIEQIKCSSCTNKILDHFRNCKCHSCKIAGAPTVLEDLMPSDNRSMCSNCVLALGKNKITPSDVDEIRGEIPKIYHYAWAVFKHLRGRSPYRHQAIEANLFCKNCNLTSCLLAVKILNNEVPNSVAQYLIKNYQPFNLTNDEIAEMIPKIWLYNKRLNSLPPSDYLNIDQIGNIFWRFIVSSYASCFAQTDYQTNQSKDLLQINYDNLKVHSNDIQLDVSNIKLNGKPNKLLEFIQNIIKEKNIMNDLNKVQNSIHNSLQTVNFDKMCCNENESPTNCKKVNPNNKRVCFHSNECKHTRKSQTRDRLRLKLKNIKPELKNSMNVQLCNNSTGNVAKPISSNKKITPLQEKPTIPCEIKKDKMEKSLNVPKVEIEKIKKPLPIDQTIKPQSNLADENLNKLVTDTFSNKNLKKWVNEAVSFIEGPNTFMNINCPENSKKAAKKAKQKQKKEESKHIEELQNLRDQFYEIYFKEFELKTELKDLKSLKKKDKKRVQDLEGNIKKFSKAKSKIENFILEGIATVKVLNSEFKFSYLPTKEQQQKYLKEKNDLQTSQGNDTKQLNETQNSLPSSYVASDPGSPRNIQISHNEVDYEGASKRIVTIRRINLPNSNEPQVTVTAKGDRPDNDKLLYTFVNGQLVPANSTNSNGATFSIPANYLSNFYGTNYTQPTNYMQQHQQQQQLINEKSNSVSKNSANNLIDKKKTKTQIKKEKQLRKKLKSEAECLLQTKEELKPISTVPLEKSDLKEVENKLTKKLDKKFKIKDMKNSINSNKNNTDEIKIDNESASALNLDQNTKKYEKEKVNKNNKKKDYSLILQNNQFNVLGLDENDGDSTDNEFNEENSDVETKLVDNSVPNKIVKKKKELINDTMNKKFVGNVKKEVQRKLNANLTDKKENQNKNNKPVKKDESINKSNSKHKISNLNDKSKLENKTNKGKNKTNNNSDTNLKHQYNTMQSNLNMSSLQASMNDMYISDTMKVNHSMSKNISIMDQLKQGIQVENLTLPPGITLTRIDPAKVEAIKAKTKTIEKLSKPLEKQQPQQRMGMPTNSLISDYIPHMAQSYASFASNEVIMVDTAPKTNTKDKFKSNQIDLNQQSKKNKKKKSKTISGQSENLMNSNNNKKSKTSAGSKVITLKNPMFDVNNLQNQDLKGHLPNYPQVVNHESPSATIFKNENGMFTIRNSALHESIELANANNIQRQYSNPNSVYLNNIYNTSFPPSQLNFSNSYGKDLPLDNENTIKSKNISAIGSEIKNAQQNKTNNSFNNDSYWPNSMSQLSMNGMSQHLNQRYNQTNFRNNLPDEAFPNANYNFLNKDNYNDVSYLDKLIMDQHLNDEVTIHNIKDVKFKSNRNLIDVDHKIDITPIPTKEQQYNGYSSMYNISGCSSNLNANNYNNINKGLNYEFENSNFLFNNGRTSQTPTNHTENTINNYTESTINDFVNDLFYDMNSLKIDDNSVAGHNLKTTPNKWW